MNREAREDGEAVEEGKDMLCVNKDEYYEPKDLRAVAGWSLTSVYGYFKDGLPYSQIGKRRYVKGSDVLDYVSSKRQSRYA
jgi:hypothetical protein